MVLAFKPVFCSIGCNRLIKQNRAKLIESATDVAETMGWEKSGQQKAVQAQLFPDLSPEEQQIIEIVRTHPNIAIDDLILAANKPPGEIATLILHLEFKGLLKTQPGKRYLAMGYNR